MTSPSLSVRIEDARDNVSIVSLAGELDLSTIPRMEEALREQMSQRPAVLIDLSELSFIDSSGIGVLVETFRSADGTPMNVLIASGSQVERVFGIAGISEALPVYSDREAALLVLGEGAERRSTETSG